MLYNNKLRGNVCMRINSDAACVSAVSSLLFSNMSLQKYDEFPVMNFSQQQLLRGLLNELALFVTSA